MNPSQEQINSWLAKATALNAPNDVIEFSITEFINEPLKYLQRFILEMKVQIDRWDLVMENLFVHPHVAKMFISYLGDAVDKPTKECQVPKIWGCSILENEYVPENMLIGFYELTARRNIDDGRNIVLGNLDLKLLNKVNQMKDFW